MLQRLLPARRQHQRLNSVSGGAIDHQNDYRTSPEKLERLTGSSAPAASVPQRGYVDFLSIHEPACGILPRLMHVAILG